MVGKKKKKKFKTDLHSASLNNVHVILRPGVVAINTKSTPEIRPQPARLAHHWRYEWPAEMGIKFRNNANGTGFSNKASEPLFKKLLLHFHNLIRNNNNSLCRK